jgi:hypothetical protein
MIVDLLNTECHYPLIKGEYFIYDNDAINNPDFVLEEKKWNLKITNSSDTNVDFFQNDGCLMTQNELKKCDWITIFKNIMYFVEAKDVNKASRRKKQRIDAIEKFEQTISYYTETYPDIINMNFFVVMNFRSKIKLTRASNKAKESYFKEEFNADYIETNYLEFK